MTAIIRPFAPADLDAIYAVSLATGHEGGDAFHLYEDKRLVGQIYSAPYAVLQPELMLVVADEDGVGGFVTGATDTSGWEDRLERDWWPELRAAYADPGETPSADWTADKRRAAMIHRPGRTPSAVARGWPSHIHLNLLPRLQRRGLGSALLDAWLNLPAVRQAGPAHVGVNRGNLGGVGFWEARGFTPLPLDGPAGRTLWMGRSSA